MTAASRMKREMTRTAVAFDDLSPQDKAEVDKFREFLRIEASPDKEARRQWWLANAEYLGLTAQEAQLLGASQ